MVDALRQRRVTDTGSQAADGMEMSRLLVEVKNLRQQLDEQERLIQTLRRDAMTDSLTGLYNRRAFESELRRSVSNCTRYDRISALLLIDLDSFKSINDRMGHQVGDFVLAHLANTLRQNTRTNDVIARLGGDEFCVILNEVRRPEDAYKKAEDLGDMIARTPCLLEDGHSVQIRASIGTRAFGADDDYDNIIADADARMYDDKKSDNN